MSDYIDLVGMDLEPYDRVKISSELNSFLEELDRKGFFLFAKQKEENIQYQNMELKSCKIGILFLKKKESS